MTDAYVIYIFFFNNSQVFSPIHTHTNSNIYKDNVYFLLFIGEIIQRDYKTNIFNAQTKQNDVLLL